MSNPDNLKYTASHEWVRVDADGSFAVGITDHAQEALGDVVFIELPEVGRRYAQGEACAVIESVKAATDIFMPVSGEVVAVNTALTDTPQDVNGDAYAAWMFRIKPDNAADTATLLDAAGYAEVASDH